MPYAPGVTDISGQLLAQGIGGGLSAVTAMIERKAEEDKKLLQLSKVADSFTKASPEILGQLGMSQEQFAAQSAKDKIAAVTGVMQAQGYKTGLQHGQLVAEELQHYRNTNAQQAYAGGQQQAEPKFLGELGKYAPPGQQPFDIAPEEFDRYSLPDGQPSVGFQQIAASAARTGFNLPPNELDNLIRATATKTDAGQFTEDPLTGARFFNRFNTTIPSGQNPAKQGQLRTIEDDEGNSWPVVYGPKGQPIVLKRGAEPKLIPAKDPESGKPMPGYFFDGTGHLHDLRSTMQKQTGMDLAPGATPTPAGPVRRWNPSTKTFEPVK